MNCVVIDMAAWRTARDQQAIRRIYASHVRVVERPTLDQVLGVEPWSGSTGDAA